MWISHFLLMSFFSSYSRSDSDCVSFFTFQVSHYNPGPTVYISHFSPFSVYLAIFQVLSCEFLIFLVGQFSCHNPATTVYMSHFSCFLCFSPYSWFKGECVSFSKFFIFLAIFQFWQCLFLVFHVFQGSRHNSGPTVYICQIYTFFSVSCHIPGPTMWFSHFPCLWVFLP